MDFYDYIEAYHTDRLKPEDRARMEEAMASDSELRETVEQFDKIGPVLDLLIEDDLRSQINKIIEANDSAPKTTVTETAEKRRLPSRKWWSLAAALVLLIGVFTFMQQEEMTVQQMALSHYHEPNLSGNKSRGPASKPLQTPADLELYKNAHEIIKDEPARARELLQQMGTPDNKLLREEIEWFMMMSYLIEGDEDRGRKLLDDIVVNPNHSYTREGFAQKLKEDLPQ